MNPLNNAWYTLGNNTHSVLDELASATPVGLKEPANQCAHANMHEVIDWNATWVYVEGVVADVVEALGDAQGYAEEAQSDIGEASEMNPDNADLDWTTTSDGVRITVSFGENYEAQNAESNLGEAIGSIEHAKGVISPLVNILQDDIENDFTGGVCSDCMMAFTTEQYNEITGSDLISLRDDKSITRDTSARTEIVQQIVDAMGRRADDLGANWGQQS
jgi:hypothetical protein